MYVISVRCTNKKEWLALLYTDTSLTEEEVIRIYGMQWNIEVFFKCTNVKLDPLRATQSWRPRPACESKSHSPTCLSLFLLLLRTA